MGKGTENIRVTYRNIRELKPYKKNAKKHPKEQVERIANSIKEFGFTQPVLVDKNDCVVAGHGRILGAKLAGLKEVPTICLNDLTEEQIKAYRLADNKLNESDWDVTLIDEEIQELLSSDVDMSLFGFDMLMSDDETERVIDDNYDGELPKDPVTKYGDIWILGKNILMCGDSTNADDVKKLMRNVVADICITSPPYNVGASPSEIGKNRRAKYENDTDNKSVQEYKLLLQKSTNNALAHSQYVFINIQQLAGNKKAMIEWLYSMRDNLADTIIWDKQRSHPAIGKNVLNSEFEFVYCFSKDGKRKIGVKEFRGTLSNIIHVMKQTKNKYSSIHNATFPIDIPSWFIENFSDKTVLDLFGGTGTTLIACEQIGRKCFMMEKDERYCDVIVDRWETLTGKKARKYKKN